MLIEDLKKNTYPGRGIIVGKTASNLACLAYFIMGRSSNSRNRIFVKKNDDLYTEAYDASKLEDPSLIIYSPVKQYKNYIIVSNGDQTDTIYDYLIQGKSFIEALNTREYEPDSPNYTPRISALIDIIDNDFTYKMSILKKEDDACLREFYDYDSKPGIGHLIHTYKEDGNPLISFKGEPIEVPIDEDINIFTDRLWNSLNEDNKISLYVRYIDLKDNSYKDIIKNKNG